MDGLISSFPSLVILCLPLGVQPFLFVAKDMPSFSPVPYTVEIEPHGGGHYTVKYVYYAPN